MGRVLKSAVCAERCEAHARPGALLRTLRRSRPGRLLRRPRRVTRYLDRPGRPGARARRRRAGGRARPADPRPPSADREAAARASKQKARLITIERIDPLTDERSIETKKLAPVAGFDLVFSPPKSVSLLHALGDEDTRRAVNEAHLTAWQAALGYLEDEACVTRRGAQGVESRARAGVRRRRLSAPHEPRPGSAPPHPRDRREHGADPRATASGARWTASRSSRATGSPPATSTRPSSAPS